MVWREELCVGGWSSADVALTLLLPILHPALLVNLQHFLHFVFVLVINVLVISVLVIIVQLLTANINMKRAKIAEVSGDI